MSNLRDSAFIEALHSDGPAADRADKMQLYGRFVGDWEMDSVYSPARAARPAKARARSISAGPCRAAPSRTSGAFPAATLTVLDDPLEKPDVRHDAAHLRPRHRRLAHHLERSGQAVLSRQIGRADGNDIVQQGADDNGTLARWRFTEIKPDSFHWLGERSARRRHRLGARRSSSSFGAPNKPNSNNAI